MRLTLVPGQLIIAARCDCTMRRAHAEDKYIYKKLKKGSQFPAHLPFIWFHSLTPTLLRVLLLSLIRAFGRSLNLRRRRSYWNRTQIKHHLSCAQREKTTRSRWSTNFLLLPLSIKTKQKKLHNCRTQNQLFTPTFFLASSTNKYIKIEIRSDDAEGLGPTG